MEQRLNAHGGKREGAGRKQNPQKKRILTVALSNDVFLKVSLMPKGSRSQFIESAISAALTD